MANKPFAIQGADLTLGGLTIQAGTTSVVIPGVTQATSYKVEEVNDTGDQTLTFQDPPQIIDYAVYFAWDTTGGYNGIQTAIYEATLDDDGYIDEIIALGTAGTYPTAVVAMNEGNDMYVYSGGQADPFATFVPTDWTQIPFRPKMQPGEIENIGGGGSVDGLQGDTSYTPEGEGDLSYSLGIDESITLKIYQGNPSGGAANLGPGISLGANIGDPHRSGVVAIGNDDVGYNSKAGGVYIGSKAGWNSDEGQQGANAIAIGTRAAYNFAEDNSITLNATGENLNPTGAGLFVKPVREDVENTTKAVYYNITTGEMTYAAPTGSTADQNIWIQTFESDTPLTDIPGSAGSIEYDSDGNIIAMFVHFNPQGGDNYTSLAKFTSTGTKLWQVRYNGAGSTDGWGVAVDSQNGFIYVTARITDPMGYDRTTVTQLSLANGSINWTNIYDFGYASTNGIIDVYNGDAVFVGYANNGTDNQVTVVKIAGEDGSIIWAKGLDGQGYDEAYGMAISSTGEVVVIGYMSQLGESGDTEDRMLVAKYSSSGTLTWQKAVLFDATYNCNGADADIDSAGNIYVCGQYQKDNGQGGTDTAMSLVKFNSSGVAQWSRRVVGDCFTLATSIVVGPDDYLYLSGVAGNNATQEFTCVIAKYQENGQVVWQRLLDNVTTWSFGGGFFTNNGGGSNIAVKDGYVAIGGGYGDPGQGPWAMIAQLDTAGTMFAVDNWDYKQATFSGILNSDASDITVDDALKTDGDLSGDITVSAFSPDTDTSNFLVPTIYRLGSTGDITFIGNDIIGSGVAEEDFAYGRMSLVPHDGSNNGQSFRDWGQYIDIYPTLANDGPHIHIAAGKGASLTGDLILGDDNQHIDINHQGYVKIRAFTDKQIPTTITLSNAEHAASNGVYEQTSDYPPRWVKDAIVTSEQYIVFDNNQWRVFDIGVNDNDPLYVSSNTIDNPPAQWNLGTFASAPAPNAAYYPPVGYARDWQFKTDGTVNFPNLEVNLHNGGPQTGQVLQFGDWTQQAIITGPRPPLGNNAQRLIIQGQRGNGVTSEGGDVYVWAGDAVTDGGDIKIYAGDADSNTEGYGGYVNISGGNGHNEGGHVHIDGGYSNNGDGGDVRIQSGGGNVPGKVQIVANGNSWEFEPTGKTTLPGAVIKGTVAKTGADPDDIGKGAAATVTVSPTNNTNLNVGTVNGIAFGTGFTLNVTVAENGDISAVVIYSIPNLSVGDYGTLGGGGVLGGTLGVDDITFTVATLTNVITATAIDLTKSVNKLTDGQYTLADGVEGQIMYFVPQTGAYSYNGVNAPILITISHVRYWNNSTGLAEVSTPGGWSPFVENAVDNAGAEIIGRFGASTMAYAIFTDGAWNVFGGAMD